MKLQDFFVSKPHLRLIFTFIIIYLSTQPVTSLLNEANRVSDKIYTNLQSDHYCSRRLNATNQMGCTSELGGNTGVVWVVESLDDIDHILKDGLTPPYIVILRRSFYSRATLLDFKVKLHRVAGVVLLDDKHDDPRSSIGPFSPEDNCPNRYSGLYANDSQYMNCKVNTWMRNSPITGLLYDDIPYPIFMINEKESIEAIEKCYRTNLIEEDKKKIQASYPLCSMQLDSFMVAASDTNTCLNSHSLVDEILQTNGIRCATVENQNIFAYFKTAQGSPHPSDRPQVFAPDRVSPQSVVLVITKLSSLSMFTDISPGADSTITGIVTMLAVAEALGRLRNNSDVIASNRNIAFAFLDSEPYDYTGSSRMTHNMQDDSFPNKYFRSKNENITEAVLNINLTALDYIINIDQVAAYPNSKKVYLHTEPRSDNPKKQQKIMDVFKRAAASDKILLEISKPTLPLPPTSVQEFIKHSQNLELDKRPYGLVLSNYDETFNNLYYNGIYDDTYNLYQVTQEELIEHISRVASLVAKSVYELAFNSDRSSDISVDRSLVAEMLDCYLNDTSCSLFTKVWRAGQQLPKSPIQTYNDPVKRSDDMNGAITTNLLAFFIGDKIDEHNLTRCYQENDESYVYNYQYVNGKSEPIKDGTSGICIRSQVLSLSSTSPAFHLTMEGIDVDTNYPAWSVSLNSIRNSVRIFMIPSPLHQLVVFFIGLFITVISFTLIYLIQDGIYRIKEEAERTGTST